MTPTEFEHDTIRPLQRLALRLRGYVLLDGLATAMLVALLGAALGFLLDWGWHLRLDMRAALLALTAVAVGVTFWRRTLVPFGRPLGPAEMALLVERRFPGLRSELISAVRFHRGQVGAPESNSPDLMAVVLDRASDDVATLPLTDVLNHGRARRSSAVATGVVALVTLAFLLAPETMGIWFDRAVLLGDTPWPKKTRLVVDLPEGVLRGARGDDLEVRAYVPDAYEAPELVDIVFTHDSGKTGREHMIRVGDHGYRYTFRRATEAFEFYLEGGDDRTETFRAVLTDRPKVERATIHVTPPAYTGLEPFTLPDRRRSVEVLPGSEVTLSIEPNKPVQQARLLAGQDHVADAVRQGDVWRVTLRPTRSQTLHFALLDEVGLENSRPARFDIRLLRDQPPQVRMSLPGVGDLITHEAILPVELDFRDDYGLAHVELVYQIAREGETERTIPLPAFSSGAKRFNHRTDLAVASLAGLVGDRVTLFARASDLDDVSGPNEASATAVTLRIVARDELLAELARREQEYRRDFERAVSAQEQLRRRLLTAMDRLARDEDRQDAMAEVAAAERGQRQIAGQVNAIRQQFEQILARMQVNRLDTDDVRQRLGEGIIAPLTRLARRDLGAAADALRRVSRAQPGEMPDLASRIDPQQVEVLATMQAALANMLKWEGFQETVTLLREILRLQKEVNEETVEEIERQAAEIFDDS
ncbi:MAG TPA: hypothetical protein VM243_03155 [Phycisphaerae bacterium]|nr:hypothetical protein [Phycisphaerae bacterium]